MNTGSRSGRIPHLLGALVAFGVAVFIAMPAVAEVPVSITQQGKLVGDDGPMTGQKDLVFELYDAETDGNLLWSDELQVDLGDNGVYTVTLGGGDNPIDATVLQDGEVYLALTVDGESFDPRMELTSVPFATISQTAEVARSVVEGGVGSEALADDAVTADALGPDSVTSEVVSDVSWEDITGIPSEVADPSDTLADLSCDAGYVALYDGTNWSCGELPSYSGDDFATSGQSCTGDRVAVGIDTDGTLNCVEQQTQSYSAGTGLNLADEEFSADTGYFDDNYLPSGESIYVEGDVEAEGNFYANANGSSTLTDIYFGNPDDNRRLFHSTTSNRYSLIGEDEFQVGGTGGSMDLRVAANADIGSSATVGDSLDVAGSTTLDGALATGGDATVDGSVNASDAVEAGGNVRVGDELLFGEDFARIWQSTVSNILYFAESAHDYEEVHFYPDVTVGGDFEATSAKSFIQPHSTDPSKQVNYIAQESGEAGVSWRGSATIDGNETVVELPDHFAEVTAHSEELTTTVTPQGQWAPLYVESKSPREVVVAVADGFDDIDDVDFDIHVQGVRAGLEDRGGYEKNTAFTPQTYGVDDDMTLVEEPESHIKARMIQNGTLNPDGTVNVETAREMGWNLQSE